jgi:hypothetical protein
LRCHSHSQAVHIELLSCDSGKLRVFKLLPVWTLTASLVSLAFAVQRACDSSKLRFCVNTQRIRQSDNCCAVPPSHRTIARTVASRQRLVALCNCTVVPRAITCRQCHPGRGNEKVHRQLAARQRATCTRWVQVDGGVLNVQHCCCGACTKAQRQLICASNRSSAAH